MEEQLISLATEHGIWAIMSIALLFYILKKQEERDSAQDEREKKYQNLLSELSQRLDIVASIRNDVEYIKEKVEKLV